MTTDAGQSDPLIQTLLARFKEDGARAAFIQLLGSMDRAGLRRIYRRSAVKAIDFQDGRRRNLFSASPLAAQQTSEAPAASVPADNGLADIVITAQRRAENLQRAALPVSAVSGDTLVTQSITRADDLMAKIGLQIVGMRDLLEAVVE